MKNEDIALIISIIALVASLLSYLNDRKTFIFSTASERAAAVKEVWGKLRRTNEHTYIRDDQWQYWSEVVSEIVSSIIILQKLTGKWRFFRWLLGINDFYIVFWEQVPTDLRMAIEKYDRSKGNPEGNEERIFMDQMRTILKTYIR
jgi:hypothetical protein